MYQILTYQKVIHIRVYSNQTQFLRNLVGLSSIIRCSLLVIRFDLVFIVSCFSKGIRLWYGLRMIQGIFFDNQRSIVSLYSNLVQDRLSLVYCLWMVQVVKNFHMLVKAEFIQGLITYSLWAEVNIFSLCRRKAMPASVQFLSTIICLTVLHLMLSSKSSFNWYQVKPYQGLKISQRWNTRLRIAESP